ncbi:unnamed protein product [Phaeothamnion confervicola]
MPSECSKPHRSTQLGAEMTGMRGWQESSAGAAVETLPLGYYAIEGHVHFFQSQLRITVERTFGLLVGRWGILWSLLRLDLCNVPRVLSALPLLHNFLQVRGAELSTPEPGSVEETQRPLTPAGRASDLFETPRAAA